MEDDMSSFDFLCLMYSVSSELSVMLESSKPNDAGYLEADGSLRQLCVSIELLPETWKILKKYFIIFSEEDGIRNCRLSHKGVTSVDFCSKKEVSRFIFNHISNIQIISTLNPCKDIKVTITENKGVIQNA